MALTTQGGYALQLDRCANAESFDWMREVEANFKEDMKIYQPFTEANAETFDKEQTYFDNGKYQHEDM